MSWATHELENYVIQKHGKLSISFLAVALGAFSPDLFTKLFVYGVHIGDWGFSQSDPIQFHRGWPGAGFTHSLLFGVIVALIILRAGRSRAWALGFLIGHWAHVLTDVNDTAGTMLFFPFSTETISTGMWRHAASLGRELDGAAYYSSLGGIWDMTWFLIVILTARATLTKEYFRGVVKPADPKVWSWLEEKAHIDERGLVAIYRGWLFYAGCRITAWTLFARFRVRYPWDVQWGGPYFVRRIDISPGPWGPAFRSALVGAVLLAAVLTLLWRFVGRRWWATAPARLALTDESRLAVSSGHADGETGLGWPVGGHPVEQGSLLPVTRRGGTA